VPENVQEGQTSAAALQQLQEEHHTAAEQGGDEAMSQPADAAAAGVNAASVSDALGILAAELEMLLAKSAGATAADAVDGAGAVDADGGASGGEGGDEQPTKRRRLSLLSSPATAAAVKSDPEAAAAAVKGEEGEEEDDLSALQMVDALAAQIAALHEKIEAHSKADHAPSTAVRKGSNSPGSPHMQDQVQHSSRCSSPAGTGDAAAAAAAAAAAPQAAAAEQQQQSAEEDLQSSTGRKQREVLATYARLKAKAEAEAAAAAAAAAAGTAAAGSKAAPAGGKRQRESSAPAAAAAAVYATRRASVGPRVCSVRGEVPEWLREWRPRARAAAALARQQQRKAAAAARRAAQQPPQQKPKQQGAGAAGGGLQQQRAREGRIAAYQSNEQQHQHKHLALMLETLMEAAGALQSPDYSQPEQPASSSAAPAAAWGQEPAAAAAAAEDAETAALAQSLVVPSFVFKTDMLPPRQQGKEGSGRRSWEGSGDESPVAAVDGSAGEPCGWFAVLVCHSGLSSS
jgi:hypothetical protein